MKKKEATETNFKEFNFEGKNNMFSGRLYIDEPRKTDKATIWSLSLTINGLAIVGSKLWVTKERQWVALPQYKAGNEYKNVCFFVDKQDNEDLEELAKNLRKLL